MEYAKCEDEMSEGTASCPDCGVKAGQDSPGSEVPLYQADVKTLLKTGKLAVYRDRTEFVTSNVQKVVFTYTGLVAVRKDLGSGIDFITEDGHTETCPADRKCVHEALVHIRQATRPYLAQRKERLLSQGVQYSFPSSQGFLNDGVLDLSDKQALIMTTASSGGIKLALKGPITGPTKRRCRKPCYWLPLKAVDWLAGLLVWIPQPVCECIP